MPMALGEPTPTLVPPKDKGQDHFKVDEEP
jgi:hypothetical protein